MTDRSAYERGLDRSTIHAADPAAAHYAAGWLAGYARQGIATGPCEPRTPQSKAWLLGYCRGVGMLRRIQAERAERRV